MDKQILNYEIAHHIFGISEEELDKFRFPLPNFADSRSSTISVILKIFPKECLRAAFDAELDAVAKRFGYRKNLKYSGASTLLTVLTPDEICAAALTVYLQADSEVPPLHTDKSHNCLFRKTLLEHSSRDRRRIP